MNTNIFFYRDGNQSVGPFSLEKLRELHRKGVVDAKTLVRSDGSDAWFEIEKILFATKIEPEIGAIIEPLESRNQEFSGTTAQQNLSHSVDASDTVETAYGNTHNARSIDSFQNTDNWDLFQIAPWRRYFARLFDITLLGFITWMLIGYTWYSLAPLQADSLFSNLNPIVDIILTTLLGCLVSGIVLGGFGTTLGKAIFGIRIRTIRGQRLSISDAIARDMSVYFRGLGLGIPIVSLVTMISAYSKLKKNQQMSWDEGLFTVYYRKSSGKQIALTMLGIILYIILLGIIKSLSV